MVVLSLLVPPNLPSTPPPARPGQAGSCLQCRQRSSAKPAWPVPPPSRSVSGQAAWERGSGGLRGRAGWRRVPWERFGTRRRHRHRSHPSPAPQSSVPPTTAPCQTPSCWRRVRGLWGPGGGNSAPQVSPPSQPTISPAEETRPSGPATPRGSPSPEEPAEEEGSGPPPAPPSPWRDTSLDRPYEKAKKPGVDPGDGETRGSRCYPGSPPAVPTAPSAPSSPDPAASPAPRAGDVPPYRFVPIRTLVLCRQAGSSAPSTPEPSGRRGQSQSLRYVLCMAGDTQGLLQRGMEITLWGGGRSNPMEMMK